MNNNDSYKDSTIKSMIWSFMDTVGSRAIQLIFQLFMARLLLPSDFGVLGIMTMFIMISVTIVDSGFKNGLLREKDSSQTDYSTVFFYNVFMALTLYVLLFFSADLISMFFEIPQLISVIRVLGLVIIIDSIGLMQKVLLTKSMRFGVQMKINIGASIISGLIAIGLALSGYGIWSLVIKVLLLQLLQCLSFIYVNRWRPSLNFSFTSFKQLFNFGWKVLISELLTLMYENLYTVIIGRGFSLTSLGFYSNAQKLSVSASDSIEISIEKVSYPLFSKLKDEGSRLKYGFQKVFKSTVFITFPVMLILASLAPALFRIVLGKNWIPAIPFFQILCLAGMFTPLHNLNLSILQVKGRSDLYLKVKFIEKLIGLVIVTMVLLLRLSIFGLLWGLVLNYFISYFINASYTKKMINYSIIDQLKDIKKITIISFLTSTAVFILNYITNLNDIILISVQGITGLIIYILLSYLFKVEELDTLYHFIKPIQKKFLWKKAYKT
ncbi:lipopolysaccharide biosynthesis protein [Alkalibacterium psychrotolerans]